MYDDGKVERDCYGYAMIISGVCREGMLYPQHTFRICAIPA